MKREFVMVEIFDRQWKALGLNDDNLRELQDELADNPKIGKVIPETGKLRKTRYAVSGYGKRKGARVIYVDFEKFSRLYLIYVYQKNQQENLTSDDKKEFKHLIRMIENELR